MAEAAADRVEFRNPVSAFTQAVAAGALSDDAGDPRCATHFMYMGHVDGAPTFKHRNTREYVDVLVECSRCDGVGHLRRPGRPDCPVCLGRGTVLGNPEKAS